MNRMFNLDSPLWNILSKFCDLLILSTLWMLFSLPVVTAGLATAALYHSVHKSILEGSGYAVSTFWKSFRTNLKQGILLMMTFLFPVAFVIVSYLFADSLGNDNLLGVFYKIISIAVGVITLSTFLYAFPVLSRFYMKTKDIWKTSIAFAVTRAFFTLILDVLTVICAISIFLAPVAGFLLPALMAMAAERLIEPAFRKAMDAKEKAEAEKEKGDENAEAEESRKEPPILRKAPISKPIVRQRKPVCVIWKSRRNNLRLFILTLNNAPRSSRLRSADPGRSASAAAVCRGGGSPARPD